MSTSIEKKSVFHPSRKPLNQITSASIFFTQENDILVTLLTENSPGLIQFFFLFTFLSTGEAGEKGEKGAPGRPGRVGPPGEKGNLDKEDVLKVFSEKMLLFLVR